MKTKEEIDEVYKKLYLSLDDSPHYHTWVRGYTQCQEDIKQYIFKVAFQFHRLGKYYGSTSDTHFTDIYEETINSLNKQD